MDQGVKTTAKFKRSAEAQRATGVSADSIRLAVGLEEIHDILADLDQALEGAK